MRGRVAGALADELLSFWAAHRALSEAAAHRRLPEGVCLLRDGGKIAGASSVHPAEVSLIGGRRFWIYRSLLPGYAAEHWFSMVRATFAALDGEAEGWPLTPVGLCVLLSGSAERGRAPEAEWADPRMIYAGYLADGRQVRIGYFKDAVIMGPSADA